MKVKKIWSNMAVANLDRTTEFYTAIGFKPNGKPNAQLTSFLAGENEFAMNFFVKTHLQEALRGELDDPLQRNEVLHTLGVESKQEADNWAHGVKAAGGTLISEPEAFGDGYYGFVFADPDGHRFNVFFMENMA